MNIIENRITKKTNLELNDSLSSFDGHSAQQHHNVYKIFYNFIKDVKPKRILEIGTALGGFTKFLRIICNELGLETKILTYDIHERPWYSDMKKNNIDVRVEDIFSKNYTIVKNDVIEFIKEEGVTIVLCDGGWKIGEFNILSGHIKSGDFIMAHDYSKNEEIFNKDIKNKIWNWLEITENDIQNAITKNSLKEYNKYDFSQAVWVCKIKE